MSQDRASAVAPDKQKFTKLWIFSIEKKSFASRSHESWNNFQRRFYSYRWKIPSNRSAVIWIPLKKIGQINEVSHWPTKSVSAIHGKSLKKATKMKIKHETLLLSLFIRVISQLFCGSMIIYIAIESTIKMYTSSESRIAV